MRSELLGAGGEHDDRHVSGAATLAQAPADLDPGDRRQHPIEHDEVGQSLVDHHQGFLAVGAHSDAIALLLEVVAKQGGERVFILDDQYIGDEASLRIGQRALRPKPVAGAPVEVHGRTRASALGRSSARAAPVISK